MKKWEVWFCTPYGWTHDSDMTYKYKWVARFVAWEHRKRGWFNYEVREATK